MKNIISKLVVFAIVSTYPAFSQTPAAPANPAGTTVAVPNDKKIEIITAQRDYVAAIASEQIQEQQEDARKQKALQTIQDLSKHMQEVVNQVKNELKVPDAARFDDKNIVFIVPSNK